MNPFDFTVLIKPHRAVREGKERTVYDIHVEDGENGNTLVFSNQGYENRQDAEAIALKLFRGRPAKMIVCDAGGQAVLTLDLSNGTVLKAE